MIGQDFRMFSPEALVIEAGQPFTFVVEIHGLNEKSLTVIDSQGIE